MVHPLQKTIQDAPCNARWLWYCKSDHVNYSIDYGNDNFDYKMVHKWAKMRVYRAKRRVLYPSKIRENVHFSKTLHWHYPTKPKKKARFRSRTHQFKNTCFLDRKHGLYPTKTIKNSRFSSKLHGLYTPPNENERRFVFFKKNSWSLNHQTKQNWAVFFHNKTLSITQMMKKMLVF